MPSLVPSWLRLRGQSWARQEGAAGGFLRVGWLSSCAGSQPEKEFPSHVLILSSLQSKHSIERWAGLFTSPENSCARRKRRRGVPSLGEEATLSHKVSGSDSSLLGREHTSTTPELISAQGGNLGLAG